MQAKEGLCSFFDPHGIITQWTEQILVDWQAL